jgi:hypothetical protein
MILLAVQPIIQNKNRGSGNRDHEDGAGGNEGKPGLSGMRRRLRELALPSKRYKFQPNLGVNEITVS